MPDGYVVIRVDSRGAGRSQGVIDIWSLREAQDLALCVDWAGEQPWSNGKVGLNGISYYAENQWQAAALQPKHLAAICTWEGAADFYRDMAHHGGIFCRGFVQDWSKAQVYTVQNGRGKRGYKSRMNGDWVSGPETLSEEELGKNRRDFYEDCLARKLDTDEYWQSRMPDWSQVKMPMLVVRQLGRAGPASARQFRGLRALGLEREMAGSARHRALDAFLHQLRSRPAEEVLRPFPQRRGHRLEPAAQGAVAGAPSRREIRRAARERMAARPHAMDQILYPPRRADDVEDGTARGRQGQLCRHERGRHLPHRAARARGRDHRPDRRQTMGVVGDRGRRPVPGGARVRARPQGSHLPGRARCAYADRARLAALLAPQAR